MTQSDNASLGPVLRSRRPQTRLDTSCTRTGRPRGYPSDDRRSGGRRLRPYGPCVRPRGVGQWHSTCETLEQRPGMVGGGCGGKAADQGEHSSANPTSTLFPLILAKSGGSLVEVACFQRGFFETREIVTNYFAYHLDILRIKALYVVANVYPQDKAPIQGQDLSQSPPRRIRTDSPRPAPAHHLFAGELGTCTGRALAGASAQNRVGAGGASLAGGGCRPRSSG